MQVSLFTKLIQVHMPCLPIIKHTSFFLDINDTKVTEPRSHSPGKPGKSPPYFFLCVCQSQRLCLVQVWCPALVPGMQLPC